MELSWSTFLLEILNFLVLVWLLRRFLFRPVLRVIDERQAAIDAVSARVRDKERAANRLAEDYDARLQSWESEREGLRRALGDELRADRERLFTQLNSDLEAERTRQRAVAERAAREETLRAEAAAISHASTFASRLLQRMTCPELEARLIALAVEDLQAVPAARRTEIRDSLRDSRGPLAITSAYPLREAHKAALSAAIAALKDGGTEVTFSTDPALIAGIRVSIGSWTLRANLADELQAFSNAPGIAT